MNAFTLKNEPVSRAAAVVYRTILHECGRLGPQDRRELFLTLLDDLSERIQALDQAFIGHFLHLSDRAAEIQERIAPWEDPREEPREQPAKEDAA